MKNLSKIFLLSLCILIISAIVIYSISGTASLKADEHPQIEQIISISDLIYTVFIYTGESLLPEYIDQFEFEAGDSVRITSRRGEFKGSWQETNLVLLSFFIAQVEAPDVTTTTTISLPIQQSVPPQTRELEKTKFQINLSGISFNSEVPPPFDIKLSTIMGIGAYFGADVFFIGFSGKVGEPTFGTITPNFAKQGDLFQKITISGLNVWFENPLEITFTGTGIKVYNIDIDDLTKREVTFRIDVDFDAEVGERSVTVTYPTGSITGNREFTINDFTGTTTSTTTP